MPIVVCQCGKRMSVPDAYIGRSITCKACGRTEVVQATTFVPATPKPLKRQPSTYIPFTLRRFVFLGFGVLFSLIGAGSAATAWTTPAWNSSYALRDRFHDDDAYGATANTLDRIDWRLRPPRPEGWIIAGLLCFAINSIDDLRWITRKALLDRPEADD